MMGLRSPGGAMDKFLTLRVADGFGNAIISGSSAPMFIISNIFVSPDSSAVPATNPRQ